MLLSKSQFFVVYEGGKQLPPGTQWSKVPNKGSVWQLIIQNNFGGKIALIKENQNEQFFQLWDNEQSLNPPGQTITVKNTIGKVFNNHGDCIIAEYDHRQHCFVTRVSNIYKVGFTGGPINFQLVGIDVFPQTITCSCGKEQILSFDDIQHERKECIECTEDILFEIEHNQSGFAIVEYAHALSK